MGRKKRAELVREMKAVLPSLDRRWIQAASREVCAALGKIVNSKLDREVRHILAFAPHYSGEIDLTPFIEEQLGRRAVYLPRVLEDRSLTFVSIGERWIDHIEAGALGIPEPELSGELFQKANANEALVIVPGLAFDREGGRIGRDFSSYGRFLRSGMTDALKIGVCWSLQFMPSIFADPEEAIMDWVCHEREAIRTGVCFAEER